MPATLRNLRMAKSFISIMVALASASPPAQNATGTQEDIVHELMPNGVSLKDLSLKPAEKAQAIKRLESAQPQAAGKRAQQIAFLLATFGSNYGKSRDYLVHALKGCGHPTGKDQCDEDTAGFLIALYNSGHDELLRPLLAAGESSDGALAEMLGDFYSNVLTGRSAQFIESIRLFPLARQKSICSLAGSTDGSGMSRETLEKSRKQLKAMGGTVALRCLREVEKANIRSSK
jgi:hypothetical protein